MYCYVLEVSPFLPLPRIFQIDNHKLEAPAMHHFAGPFISSTIGEWTLFRRERQTFRIVTPEVLLPFSSQTLPFRMQSVLDYST